MRRRWETRDGGWCNDVDLSIRTEKEEAGCEQLRTRHVNLARRRVGALAIANGTRNQDSADRSNMKDNRTRRVPRCLLFRYLRTSVVARMLLCSSALAGLLYSSRFFFRMHPFSNVLAGPGWNRDSSDLTPDSDQTENEDRRHYSDGVFGEMDFESVKKSIDGEKKFCIEFGNNIMEIGNPYEEDVNSTTLPFVDPVVSLRYRYDWLLSFRAGADLLVRMRRKGTVGTDANNKNQTFFQLRKAVAAIQTHGDLNGEDHLLVSFAENSPLQMHLRKAQDHRINQCIDVWWEVDQESDYISRTASVWQCFTLNKEAKLFEIPDLRHPMLRKAPPVTWWSSLATPPFGCGWETSMNNSNGQREAGLPPHEASPFSEVSRLSGGMAERKRVSFFLSTGASIHVHQNPSSFLTSLSGDEFCIKSQNNTIGQDPKLKWSFCGFENLRQAIAENWRSSTDNTKTMDDERDLSNRISELSLKGTSQQQSLSVWGLPFFLPANDVTNIEDLLNFSHSLAQNLTKDEMKQHKPATDNFGIRSIGAIIVPFPIWTRFLSSNPSMPSPSSQTYEDLRKILREHGFDPVLEVVEASTDFLPPTKAPLYIPNELENKDSVILSLNRNGYQGIYQQHDVFLGQQEFIPGRNNSFELRSGVSSILSSVLSNQAKRFPVPTVTVPGKIKLGENHADGVFSSENALFIRSLQVAALISPSFALNVEKAFGGVGGTLRKMLLRAYRRLSVLRGRIRKYLGSFELAIRSQPSIRPMFFAQSEPSLKRMRECKAPVYSEWLIGDDIVVAPILDELEHRNVYLPHGHWLDLMHRPSSSSSKDQGPYHKGPKCLRLHRAGILEVPVFEKVREFPYHPEL